MIYSYCAGVIFKKRTDKGKRKQSPSPKVRSFEEAWIKEGNQSQCSATFHDRRQQKSDITFAAQCMLIERPCIKSWLVASARKWRFHPEPKTPTPDNKILFILLFQGSRRTVSIWASEGTMLIRGPATRSETYRKGLSIGSSFQRVYNPGLRSPHLSVSVPSTDGHWVPRKLHRWSTRQSTRVWKCWEDRSGAFRWRSAHESSTNGITPNLIVRFAWISGRGLRVAGWLGNGIAY